MGGLEKLGNLGGIRREERGRGRGEEKEEEGGREGMEWRRV